MNKRNLFTLTAMLGLCSTSFMFVNAASAQVSWEVQQLLDENDALTREIEEFVQNTEQQRQEEMNALSSSCNSGDSDACLEHEIRLRAEDRAIDYHTETLRNRRLCGSPVCY